MKTTKKFLSVLLAVMMMAMTMTVLAIPSSALDATGSCGNNVTWSFNASTGELTIKGKGAMTDYTDTYWGSPSPFADCNEIKSVLVKDGVEYIGSHAFDGCRNLKSARLANSVKEIGQNAFYYSGLESIKIPNGMSEISSYAFYYARSLETVIIPKSVSRIDYCSFEGTILRDIYYAGNESQWNAVRVDTKNDTNSRVATAQKHFNYVDTADDSDLYENTGDGSSPANYCRWCGEVHGSGFLQKITAWFHSLFAKIFGAKY